MPFSLGCSWLLASPTPDMHRVHHSSWHRETDSNYGATLAIWDHVFGTFRAKEPEALEQMEIGLREARGDRANSLVWLLALPFRPIRIPRDPAATENGAANKIKEAA